MISLLLVEITARYRIDPAFVKRMATRDAPDAQPGALENTMQLDRLDRVLGARRVVAAIVAEKGADNKLVTTYQHDEQPSCQGCQGIHGNDATGRFWKLRMK